MEIEQLRKTEFREMGKNIGLETHTVVLDGDDWFEQLTDGVRDYFCTKEWAGDSKGNFSKLKDGINSHYASFQITEI